MLCWAEQLEFSTLIGVNCHARIPNWLTTFTLLIEKITLKNRRVNTLILNRFKRTPLWSFYWVWFYILIIWELCTLKLKRIYHWILYVPSLIVWMLSFEFQLIAQCYRQLLYWAPLSITLKIKIWVVAYFFNFFQFFQKNIKEIIKAILCNFSMQLLKIQIWYPAR